jgi:hypothetical protein
MLVSGPLLAPPLLAAPTSAVLARAGVGQPTSVGVLQANPHGSFSAALRAALAVPQPRRGGPRPEAPELDAATRQAAHLAPPGFSSDALVQPRMPTSPAEAPAAPQAASLPSLEEIMPALVRKIAWSGDARRGAVRIELGSGALAGATLLVAADHGHVKVTLSAHACAPLEPWRERIAARLAARGLDVDVT